MLRRTLVLIAIVKIGLTGCASLAPPAPGALVGPLVGHVTDRSAAIWMYGGPDARFRIDVSRIDGATDAPAQSVEFGPAAGTTPAALVTLGDLEPQTRYRYAIVPLHDPAARPAWERAGDGGIAGTFTTAPPPGTPGRFTAAVASCIKTRPSMQAAWPLLLAQEPSIQLLLGDNAYSNSTDPRVIRDAHLAVRSMPGFASVIRQVPTWAIWDDHDYADNNAGAEAEGKERSLRAFKALWPNPAAGLDAAPGVFHRFAWGDVEFFMLDVRYERTNVSEPDGPEKQMLGPAQLAWLADALAGSTATFKVIASGSTLRESPYDGWRDYDFARRRLFSMIADAGIEGVLFVTGDVHYSVVDTHDAAETGTYALTEVISSGIANSARMSFATLEFDTTLPDPTVRIRIIDGNRSVPVDRVLRRSELRPPPVARAAPWRRPGPLLTPRRASAATRRDDGRRPGGSAASSPARAW